MNDSILKILDDCTVMPATYCEKFKLGDTKFADDETMTATMCQHLVGRTIALMRHYLFTNMTKEMAAVIFDAACLVDFYADSKESKPAMMKAMLELIDDARQIGVKQ